MIDPTYKRNDDRSGSLSMSGYTYLSMDQPPIAGGPFRTGNEEHRESAFAYVCIGAQEEGVIDDVIGILRV